MNVTLMLIVIEILQKAPKVWVEPPEEVEIGGRIKIIQTTELLRSARLHKIVIEN